MVELVKGGTTKWVLPVLVCLGPVWGEAMHAQTVGRTIYKKPHEVGISTTVLARLENALNQPRAACGDAQAREIQAEMAKYTTQFINDKRILDERRTGRFDPTRLDKNTIRLLSLARRNSYGKIEFLGESPLMYRLHRALGRCYELQKRIYRALSEYSMAFRYTSFEQPWRELPNTPPADIKPAGLKIRERRYQFMLRGFADENRLKEDGDAAITTAGNNFRTLLAAYVDGKVQTAAALRRIDAYMARRIRGDFSVDPVAARADYNRLKARQENLLTQLENIRRGPYKRYHDTKTERDGELAYVMALLIKDLETKNKKLQRILNRSSFYRGIGSGQVRDKTRFNRFVGYGIFLELANKIDPDNTRYISLLAEEYRNSRLNTRAIVFEERYLELSLKKTPPPPAADLAEHYHRLGGLYTDIRNYEKATAAYVENLKYDTDAGRITRTRLHLADLYFTHTGRFDQAETLYTAHMAESSRLDPAAMDYRGRARHHAVRYRVQRNLAAIARGKYRTEREKQALAAARRELEAMEKDFREFVEQEKAMGVRILNIKRQLLNQEDDALQIEYYKLLRRDLPDLQERTRYLRTHINALNLPRILERQAFIALRERRFRDALGRYREIIIRGTGEQATRARRNIQLINLTLTDGLIRRPILPPDFER